MLKTKTKNEWTSHAGKSHTDTESITLSNTAAQFTFLNLLCTQKEETTKIHKYRVIVVYVSISIAINSFCVNIHMWEPVCNCVCDIAQFTLICSLYCSQFLPLIAIVWFYQSFWSTSSFLVILLQTTWFSIPIRHIRTHCGRLPVRTDSGTILIADELAT